MVKGSSYIQKASLQMIIIQAFTTEKNTKKVVLISSRYLRMHCEKQQLCRAVVPFLQDTTVSRNETISTQINHSTKRHSVIDFSPITPITV